MNLKSQILTIASLLIVVCLPAGADEKKHEHTKKEPGPGGGRLITSVQPHLEFLVNSERKVQISAVGNDGKITPLASQVISVTAGERSKPVKLEFKNEGGKLVSTNTLPAGDGYPVSVSIKENASARATYEKFNLELGKCPTCKHPEYACICAHSHD